MFLREKYFILEYCEAQLLQPKFAPISLSAAGECRFNILVCVNYRLSNFRVIQRNILKPMKTSDVNKTKFLRPRPRPK